MIPLHLFFIWWTEKTQTDKIKNNKLKDTYRKSSISLYVSNKPMIYSRYSLWTCNETHILWSGLQQFSYLHEKVNLKSCTSETAGQRPQMQLSECWHDWVSIICPCTTLPPSMPRHHHFVPPCFKAQVLLLYPNNCSVKDICHILGLKKSLVYKILSFHLQYSTITDLYKYSHLFGHCWILTSAGVDFIFTVVKHHSTIDLNEIQHELWAKCHKSILFSTLLQTLCQLCITWKVISAPTMEWNEERHALYMNCIATDALVPNMLIFIDKATKDRWMSTHQHGWLVRGVHCCVQRYFVHGTRYYLIMISQWLLLFVHVRISPLTKWKGISEYWVTLCSWISVVFSICNSTVTMCYATKLTETMHYDCVNDM